MGGMGGRIIWQVDLRSVGKGWADCADEWMPQLENARTQGVATVGLEHHWRTPKGGNRTTVYTIDVAAQKQTSGDNGMERPMRRVMLME